MKNCITSISQRSFINQSYKNFYSISLLACILIMFTISFSYGQNYVTRIYATGPTSVGGLGVSTNNDGAKDGDVSTASVISIGLVGSRFQRVQFPAAVTNKPLHIKVGSGVSLLSLLPTVTIQAYNGGNALGNRVGDEQVLSGSSLLHLLNGTNTYEYIYTPSTTANYDRIRVTFTAVVIGATSISLYDAYYEEAITSAIACDSYVDVLSGSTGSLVAGLTTTVTDPANAVNGNESDYAEITAVAGALDNSYLRVLYPGTSRTGDMVRVLLENPADLLSLGLLDNVGIYTYNGNTLVDTQADASLLSLQLLTGSTKGYVTFPSSGAFDRIEVRVGGALNVLGFLRVFEIQRFAPAPTLTTQNTIIYSGNTASLTATPGAGDGVIWTPSGSTNTTYITPVLTSNTSYEVQAIRPGCTNRSAAATALVTVLPAPSFTNPASLVEGKLYDSGSGKQIVISGQPGSNYQFSNVVGLPAGLTLNPNGTITGTPAAGTGTGLPVAFKATVFDQTLNKIVFSEQTFSITIYLELALTGGEYPIGYVGQTSYSNGLTSVVNSQSGGGRGSAFYTYSLTNPSGRTLAAGIPTNFSLSPAAVLSTTTPLTSGQVDTYTFDVYISDGIQQDVATFTFTIATSPLPVTLSLFKAKKEGQSASLMWTTTSESNSDGFDVEHSCNGKDWFKIGYQQAKGESAAIENYYFTDNTPFEGENLYRLKMTDRDGTFAYSRIESLNFSLDAAIILYPNPIVNSENLRISINDWSNVKSVRIINLMGKTVFESTAIYNFQIKTDHLVSGLYFIQFIQKSGKINTRKFVKL